MINATCKICSVLLLTFFIVSSASCRPKRRTDDARKIVAGMTLDQKIGQLIMVGVPGTKLNNDTKSIIERYKPGGIILFGFNIRNMEQTRSFISDMQNYSMETNGMPMLVSIDQEGGRVWRIREGVTLFPGNMALGAASDRTLTYRVGRILGMQLRMIGVNMNLAPVLDVNNNPDNPVINTRSFGSNPLEVAMLGISYILGLQESWCIAVGKHFPGHGDTNADSHLTLPVIPYDMERLKKIELFPFAKAVKGGVESIMTAHISYPNIIHDNSPATLSKLFLTDILRNRMKFKGIIITDDMEMHAISKNYGIGNAAVTSIKAGTDIVLISSNGRSISAIVNAIKGAVQHGELTTGRIDASVTRIIETKLRYHIMDLKENKIISSYPEYSEEDKSFLRTADAVNREVTRKSIYAQNFQGDLLKTMTAPGTMKVIITDNPVIASECRRRIGNSCVVANESNLRSSVASVNKRIAANQKLAIFYHIHTANISRIRYAVSIAKKYDASLCLLSTGNPFPLSRLTPLPPVIYSFSNTGESMKQIAECIAGDFTPRQSIKFSLGYSE